MAENKKADSEKIKFMKFLGRTFGGFILWSFYLTMLIFAWFNVGHQINPVVFKDVPISNTTNFIAISIFTLILYGGLWLLYAVASKDK